MFTSFLLLTMMSGGLSDQPSNLLRLESPSLSVEIEPRAGTWSILDKAAETRWPSQGDSTPGLAGPFSSERLGDAEVKLTNDRGDSVRFRLVDDGKGLELRYEGQELGELHVLADALTVTARDRGAVIIPSREGLSIPADSGVAFQQSFGTSEYEGCHMNMVGVLKGRAVLAVTWDGANVWANVKSTLPHDPADVQAITTTLELRKGARAFRLFPMGQGDWNTLAAGYRRIAETKGLVATIQEKERRDPRMERLLGSANVKLWTCLNRKMNEESTKEESHVVHWTFDETAQVAEHLKNDLGIDRCLFTIGGWTEGGYDCRHPDNLPANPECGGNAGLADAVRRVQDLGYVACLHDNYQDIYRDAKSCSPDLIEKKPDGSLVQGGRWLGGRAFMVCAPKQLEMASRPQNLPEIEKLFRPWAYFIDTTYAVGPRECFDPAHPIGRDDDIAWKIKLSDYARERFGLFGSECGREWALAHSDFFEGLVGVSGTYYHNLKPASLGATVIPFWEMVYHDVQVCYGKYGFSERQAGEYVAFHVLTARTLNYHSIPNHLYWKEPGEHHSAPSMDPKAAFTRTDQGWAEGMHPTDAFLKTTHEVLGPLNLATAHQRLTRFEFLKPDGSVRKATYGDGDDATTVVVNFGKDDATVASTLGGDVILPTFGFVVDGPRQSSFYAKRWGGHDYPDAVLFTIRSEDNSRLSQASPVRVFHGYGDLHLPWRGSDHEVRREAVIQPQ